MLGVRVCSILTVELIAGSLRRLLFYHRDSNTPQGDSLSGLTRGGGGGYRLDRHGDADNLPAG